MKRLLIVGALAVASAIPFTLSASAADTCAPATPAGVTCAGGDAGTRQGHVYADGNESNPCPLSGYLAVDNNGVSGAETGTYTPGANTIVGADGTLPDGSGGAPCGLG